jgi:hypothetical protein
MNHYVILKLHDGQDKTEFAQNARSILTELVEAIDGVQKVNVHENVVDRPDNYDIMLHFEMDGKDTLYTYIEHSIHKRFIAYAQSKVASKISFDW